MITVNDADAYFATRLDSEDWDQVDDTEKFKALTTAFRYLSRLNFAIIPPVDLFNEALCEVAINLLDGTNMEQEIENLFSVSQSYATVTTGYNSNIIPDHLRAGIPSAVAWNIILPYLRDPTTIKLSRG